MQTIEAAISLLVFLSIAALVLSYDPGPPALDDSLYSIQLAEDVWRVLYLRGDFRGFGPEKRIMLESDMSIIEEQTGLCVFIKGIEYTNCRAGEQHEIIASLKRTILINGQPEAITFTISH